MAVRPFVARPEMQLEDAALPDFHTLQNVRLQQEFRRVAQEPRIAVDDQLARILGLGHQHAQVSAMPAGPGFPVEMRDGRQALFDGGQHPGADPLGERRRFDRSGQGCARKQGERREQDRQRPHAASPPGAASSPRRTKCPSSISSNTPLAPPASR